MGGVGILKLERRESSEVDHGRRLVHRLAESVAA